MILLLILGNGVLAMSEIAIVSSRRARLQRLANEGHAGASVALELAERPSHFLSTVQVGITLVGILAGAFSGATIAEQLAGWLGRIPRLGPYSQAIGIGVVVVAVTYLSLIVGELVPKRLALNDAERTATALAVPMRMLSRAASPVVRFISLSTDAVLRLIHARPSSEPGVTEEEINILIEQGTESGLFAAAEQEMVEGVFRLGDLRVDALVTPRTGIVWLDVNDPPDETRRKIVENGHSRYPVAQDDLDNLLGVVQSHDLLARTLAGQPLDLRAALRPPVFVPEGTPALQVLEVFREAGMHLALVIDEYGGVQGLVTLDDVLEAVVGEIPEAGERPEPAALQREDGSWLCDGMLPIAEFKEIFLIAALPKEDRGYYRTLGGFVMTHTGRIPGVGDRFEWNGLSFEVVDMDGLRVDKVLVVPAPHPPSPEGGGE